MFLNVAAARSDLNERPSCNLNKMRYKDCFSCATPAGRTCVIPEWRLVAIPMWVIMGH
jgi:hypothetical protein